MDVSPMVDCQDDGRSMTFITKTYFIRHGASPEAIRERLEAEREFGRLILEDGEEETETETWVCYWGMRETNPPRLMGDVWHVPIYKYFTCKEEEKQYLEKKVIKKIN